MWKYLNRWEQAFHKEVMMNLEKYARLLREGLTVRFSGCIAVGAMLSSTVADTCEGHGYQTATGEHRLACLGAGNCAGTCTATIDKASMPGLQISWCGCGVAPGSKMSCDFVTVPCTPVLLRNDGGSVWLACMNCDCYVTEPPVVNGSCALTWTIPVGLANAANTCVCFTFPD